MTAIAAAPPRDHDGRLGATLAVVFVLALLLIPDRYTLPPAGLGDVGVAVRPYQVVLLALLVVLGARFLAGHRLCARAPATLLVLLPVAAGASFVANVGRLDEHFLIASVRAFGEMLMLAATALAIACIAATAGRRRLILSAVAVALTLSASLGAWEAATERRSLVGLEQTVPVLGVERFQPRPDGPAAGAEDDLADEGPGFMMRGGNIRVVGAAKHAIELSALMAIGVPIVVALAAGTSRLWCRLLAAAASVLMLVVLLLSGSRTGAVGAVVALATIVVLNRARPRVWVPGVCAALLLTALAVAIAPGQATTVAAQFSGTSSDDSVEARTTDYGELDRLIGGAPWLGRGPGAWASYVTDTGEPLLLDNQYLLAADETGLVGAGAFVIVLLAAMTGARRWAAQAGVERAVAVAVASGIVTFAVMAAFFDALYFSQVASLTMVLTGIVAGALASP